MYLRRARAHVLTYSRRGTEEHALHLVFSLSVPPSFVCFPPTALSSSRFFPRGLSTSRPAAPPARFALLLALCKVKNCLGSLAATRRDPVRALGHWLCHRHRHRHPRYQLPPFPLFLLSSPLTCHHLHLPPPSPLPPTPLLDLPRSRIAYRFLYASFGTSYIDTTRTLFLPSVILLLLFLFLFHFHLLLVSSFAVLFALFIHSLPSLLSHTRTPPRSIRTIPSWKKRDAAAAAAGGSVACRLHWTAPANGDNHVCIRIQVPRVCTLPGHRTASSSPPCKLGSIYGQRFADGVGSWLRYLDEQVTA